MEAGKEMGLHGNELLQFVTEQQKLERDERAKEPEERAKEAEREERTKEIEGEERAKEVEREERAKEIEREERAKEVEREERTKNVEREEEAKEEEKEERERKHAAVREYELQQMKLKLEYEVHLATNENMNEKKNDHVGLAKVPKLPVFVEEKDDLDAYLE